MTLPTIQRSRDEATLPERSTPRRRGKRLLLPLAMLLIVGTLLGMYLWFAAVSQRQLDNALAEANRLDPGWTLEDLEKQQPSSFVEEEVLRGLADAYASRPPTQPQWPSSDLNEVLQNPAPEKQLDERKLGIWRADVQRVAAVTEKSRKLVRYPQGSIRLRTVMQADDLFNSGVHAQSYFLVHALQFEARFHAQEGDAGAALASLRIALQLNGLTGEVSNFLIAQVRVGRRQMILLALEETLAQTQPAEESLADWQRLLEIEEAVPTLRNAFRGERAFMNWIYTGIEKGETTISRHPMANFWSFSEPENQLPPVADVYDRLGIPMVRHVHAVTLQYLSQLIEISKLPVAQQQTAFANLRMPEEAIPHFYLPMLPHFYSRATTLFPYHDAQIRCTIAALAAERYRLRHGTWPKSLAAIAPDPLPESWTDPNDGLPLRFLALDDGIVVYSLGPAGVDSQGKIDRRNYNAPGTNWGVRLWDPAHRRQPAVFGPVQK